VKGLTYALSSSGSLQQNTQNSSPNRINIGIVSCYNYQNHLKINKVFEELVKLNTDFTVLSGGNALGSDSYIKKISLSLRKNYIEFPPKHYTYNEHCYFPKEYFNKDDYSPKNYIARYMNILQYSDMIIIFKNKDIEDNTIGYFIKNLDLEHNNKPFIIID
jgi:hypothetical protein